MIFTILDFVGYGTAVLFLVTLVLGLYTWFRGILPAIIRLGNGLAKRKIAIFAKGDHFTGLKDLLVDSKLFKAKNIIQVASQNEFGRAEQSTLYLLYWPDWQNDLDDILKKKKAADALIVYAPQELGFIPTAQMSALSRHSYVTTTNFRGRLLNDIVVSMITTSYKQ